MKDFMQKTYYSILSCELINNAYFLYDSVVCETLTRHVTVISRVQYESVCEEENAEPEGHDKIKFASFTIHQVGKNHLHSYGLQLFVAILESVAQ